MAPASLVQIVDAALASATLRSGTHLACGPGCSQCCHGVFEISALDAQRLRESLHLAPLALQARIRARLAASREHLAPFFPGSLVTGVLSADAEAVELFEEWAHTEACPILDPETQTCDLYAARPILCRTFGPPIRNDADDASAGLAICELCFTHATQEEIVGAEMDASFRALEDSLESAYAAEHPDAGSTIVAFAFPAEA